MYRKISGVIITILMMVLTISSVAAFDAFIYPTSEDSDKIFFDEVAKYDVTIENFNDKDVVYSIVVNPVEWIAESNTNVLVKAGEKNVFPLNIKPNPVYFKGPGNYNIPVTIKSANGELVDTFVRIAIKSFKDGYGQYTPAISMSVIVKEQLDPRNKLNVQVILKNRNILELENLSLVMYSDIFEKSDIVSLGALAERSLQYYIDVDSLVQPGNYPMTFVVKLDDKVLSQTNNALEVLPYSVIDREKNEFSKFFKNTMITTLVNNGNVKKDVRISLDTAWYKRIVSSVDIEAQVYEETKNDWVITLEPAEQSTVIIEENYRWYVFLIVLIILIIITYFVSRSPIVIEKQIIVTGKDEEGTSEMKVRVFAKNRTGKPFFNLRLIDIAPSIATVIDQDYFGVVKPSKIIPTEKKGTIVKWDIDSLEAYEERIFSYTLKARLKIIGNVSLPAIKAKFEDAKGNERAISSKKAMIGAKN